MTVLKWLMTWGIFLTIDIVLLDGAIIRILETHFTIFIVATIGISVSKVRVN